LWVGSTIALAAKAAVATSWTRRISRTSDADAAVWRHARRARPSAAAGWPPPADLDVVEDHGDFTERLRHGVLGGSGRGRRDRRWGSGHGFRTSLRLDRRDSRSCLRHGRSPTISLSLDIHQVLDAFADLRRHELHALREVTGERLGLVSGRFAQGCGVACVRVERHGGQRNHR
jgi:hypothetical protein